MLDDQDVVSCDNDVLHGTPVFTGTRVPVTTLFDYLLGGSSLDECYEDFPTVTRAHVTGMLTSIRAYIGAQYQDHHQPLLRGTPHFH
jgi:uncharacterized protein (DUF433 family)